MGENKITKDNIRSVQKSKRSYYITLPINYVRRLGWDEPGKAVVVSAEGKKMVIEELGGEAPRFELETATKIKWKRKTSKK